MTTEQKPNFHTSIEAQKITKLLEGSPIGATTAYASIVKEAGATNLNAIRGAIQTARRSLQREKQIVFGVVTGIGLRRLDDSEIVDAGRNGLSIVRRANKRVAKTLACADISKLPKEKAQENLRIQSMVGAIHLCTSRKAENSLEQKQLTTGAAPLQVGDLGALFKS